MAGGVPNLRLDSLPVNLQRTCTAAFSAVPRGKVPDRWVSSSRGCTGPRRQNPQRWTALDARQHADETAIAATSAAGRAGITPKASAA